MAIPSQWYGSLCSSSFRMIIKYLGRMSVLRTPCQFCWPSPPDTESGEKIGRVNPPLDVILHDYCFAAFIRYQNLSFPFAEFQLIAGSVAFVLLLSLDVTYVTGSQCQGRELRFIQVINLGSILFLIFCLLRYRMCFQIN